MVSLFLAKGCAVRSTLCSGRVEAVASRISLSTALTSRRHIQARAAATDEDTTMVQLANAANGGPSDELHTPETSICAEPKYKGAGRDRDALYDFDLFVIGGGSGGVRAARHSAKLGARVALCELPRGPIASEEAGGIGGTCVLRGCVPKKLMSIAASFSEDFVDARAFGWNVECNPQMLWEEFMARKDKELARLSDLYKRNLESSGATYFEGRGQVLGPDSVLINGHRFKVKNILIATGGSAVKPPIDGVEHAIISDQVLTLPKLPKKLIVIGGGYIGCEQASIYNNFGTEVHLIIREDAPLAGFDQELRDFVGGEYDKRGLHLHRNTSPVKISKAGDGKLSVECEPKEGEKFTIDGVDHVLMATGRKPNAQGIGLEEAGVEMDKKGGIKVDEHSRSVSCPSIWAIGDVANRIPLTPVARMEGSALAAHLFGHEVQTKPNYELCPSVVFSDPQLAYVGLSEQKALEEYENLDVYSSIFTPMKHSLARQNVKAITKVVVDADSDKVLGMHMVGAEAAEIMQGFAAAMKAGITKFQLDETIGLHPTSAEEFVTMASPTRQYRNKKLHCDADAQ